MNALETYGKQFQETLDKMTQIVLIHEEKWTFYSTSLHPCRPWQHKEWL